MSHGDSRWLGQLVQLFMNDEHKTFIRWLARFAGSGSYAPGFHAWNWRIGGVLVTLWLGNGIVKIYHEQGRRTHWHPFNTERCREDVLSLLNAKVSHDQNGGTKHG